MTQVPNTGTPLTSHGTSFAGGTDVAYVGGAGRSGSTMLALLMAQLPDVVAAGGVSNLWERGLKGNYLCGCGKRFHECAFWDDVGRVAFGGWSNVDADQLLRLKSELCRYRQWPWLLTRSARPGFEARLSEYCAAMSRLYAAIKSVSGATVVVDNSHDIMSALALRRTPGVNLRSSTS